MKFTVDEKVVVIKQPPNANVNMIGAIGIIVDIDEGWMYPYEVEFEDGHDYPVNLFEEDSLDYAEKYVSSKHVVEDESSDRSNNKFDEEEIIDTIIYRLEHLEGTRSWSPEVVQAIHRLTEARMWLGERSRKRKEFEQYEKYQQG